VTYNRHVAVRRVDKKSWLKWCFSLKLMTLRLRRLHKVQIMSGALRNPEISEAEYLASELIRQEKHEFISGQVFAMSGASIRHNQIAINVLVALHAHALSPCRVSISDVKFKAKQLYYYPDVMVACAPQTDALCETQPCLIVEVLSDATESVDRGEKLHHYQKVPELEAYLLVSQKQRRVDVFKRSGAFWRFESLTDSAVIELSCPTMKLSLDSIYRGVLLDANERIRAESDPEKSDL
jgi:Uma2 family endonuclease